MSHDESSIDVDGDVEILAVPSAGIMRPQLNTT
jgi:hypothetical protein